MRSLVSRDAYRDHAGANCALRAAEVRVFNRSSLNGDGCSFKGDEAGRLGVLDFVAEDADALADLETGETRCTGVCSRRRGRL